MGHLNSKQYTRTTTYISNHNNDNHNISHYIEDESNVTNQTPHQHVVYRAAKAGDLAALKYWIEEQDFYVDEIDFYSNTLLYYSALCGHLHLIKYLLECGAAFCREDPEGGRIYICAAKNDVRELLATVNQAKRIKEPWFVDYVNSCELSDLQFVVQDDTSSPIHAHRVLVAARCPDLVSQLDQGACVVLNQVITRKDLLELLLLLYTDKASNSNHARRRVEYFLTLVFKITKDLALGSALLYMVNNAQYSDIVLVTSDEEHIHAHKVVLAYKSEYFKTLFGNKWAEKDVAKIQVDASAGTLITLLKYIYSNKYEVTPENILDVIAGADRLLLLSLKHELELEVVRDYLNLDSCIDLFLFSETTNCEELRKASYSRFAKNRARLEETPKFMDLPLEHQQCFWNYK